MKIAIITINKEGEKLAKALKVNFPDAKIFNGRINRKATGQSTGEIPVSVIANEVKQSRFYRQRLLRPEASGLAMTAMPPLTDRLRRKVSLKNLVRVIFNEYDGLIFIAALGITVRLVSGFIRSKLTDPAIVSVDTAGRFSISLLSGHEGGANKLAFLVAANLQALPVITTGQEVHKKFILGIGTRKGIDADKVKRAIKKAVKKKNIELKAIRLAATVDLKKNESGLIKACHDLGLPLIFIPKESIRNYRGGISASDIVKRHIGLDGVCEPCALLAGRRARLILKKEARDGVAVALAREDYA
jgi:cobalt-precorrin 5A hydrolase